jgi:hypothetical protein
MHEQSGSFCKKTEKRRSLRGVRVPMVSNRDFQKAMGQQLPNLNPLAVFEYDCRIGSTLPPFHEQVKSRTKLKKI